MRENDLLAQQFEENRARLRGVAYRMLGSMSEADDAVQEAWFRLSRGETSQIQNLGGWLTTVVARVCLDVLRSRKSRREESLDAESPAVPPPRARTSDPEREALLADSVGLALLVVLDRLEPAERLAFVLHDMFAVPFDEIASIVGRTATATRQLASRARRRVQGPAAIPRPQFSEHRQVVDAFLAALRAGDFEGLVAVLDPNVSIRADAVAAAGGAAEVNGAETSAREALARAKGARFLRPALINGTVGAILAPGGRLLKALMFTFKDGKIVEAFAIGERAALDDLDLAVLKD